VIIAGLTSSWRGMSIGESGGQFAAGKRRTLAPQPSRFPATTRRGRAAPPRKPLFPFRRRLAVLLVFSFFLEEAVLLVRKSFCGGPWLDGPRSGSKVWKQLGHPRAVASMELEPTLETKSTSTRSSKRTKKLNL
jgi:hypothetical protein